MDDRERVIAIIAQTNPLQDTGHGYGNICIYKCKNTASIDFTHTDNCPWILFRALPEVEAASASYLMVEAAKAERKRQQILAAERVQDMLELERLKKKLGV